MTGVAVYRALDPFMRSFAGGFVAAWDAVGHALGPGGGAAQVVARAVRRTWTKGVSISEATVKWPDGNVENFKEVAVYEDGDLRLGLGYGADPVAIKGRKRTHVPVIKLGPKGGLRPINYFIEADDFVTTDEMVAPIAGRDGGRVYFKPGDSLPAEYDGMRVDTFGDRVAGHWNILCVVADKDDVETMLAHGAAQVGLRNI